MTIRALIAHLICDGPPDGACVQGPDATSAQISCTTYTPGGKIAPLSGWRSYIVDADPRHNCAPCWSLRNKRPE